MIGAGPIGSQASEFEIVAALRCTCSARWRCCSALNRAAAVSMGIPCITTLQAADAAVKAMEALREEPMAVQTIQDRFPRYGTKACPGG